MMIQCIRGRSIAVLSVEGNVFQESITSLICGKNE